MEANGFETNQPNAVSRSAGQTVSTSTVITDNSINWTNITGGNRIQATVTFPSITSSYGQFQLINSIGEVITNWTMDQPSPGLGATSRTITATPPSDPTRALDGQYILRVLPNTMRRFGITATFPTSNVDTSLVLVEQPYTLAAGTTTTLPNPSTRPNFSITGIANYNNNLYGIWRIQYGESFLVTKHDLNGTRDATADVTIPEPTVAPTGYTTANFVTFRGIEVDDNKIYLGGFWNNGTTQRAAIVEYTIDASSHSIVLELPDETRTDDLSIKGDNMLVSMRHIATPNTYDVRLYTRSSGTWGTTETRIFDQTTAELAAFSDKRIYLGEGNTVQSYTDDYYRATGEDISAGRSYRAGTVAGNTLYAISGTSLYRWTGVPVVAAPEITGTWNPTTPAVASGTRAISSTITFSAAPRNFNISAFKVDLQSGMDWNEQTTGWTITAGTGTTSRLITATPDNSVAGGTYRIRLPNDGFETNQPSAETSTDGAVVPASLVATAAWSNVSFTGGKLQGTITFSGHNVTNIATSDFVVLDASDDSEVSPAWTFDNLSSSTVNAGGTLIVRATAPANTNGSFKLRLKEESVRSGGSATDNAPADDVDSTAVSIDIRPALTATIVPVTSSTSSNEISDITTTFTLTLSSSVPNAQITTSDFSTSDTNVSITGVSAAANPNITYTVTATHPTNASGSYTVTFNMNSVAGTSTYKPGPASDVVTTATTYYNVPARIATAAWSNEAWDTGNDGKLRGTLTFTTPTPNASIDITGLTEADFEVVDDSSTPVVQTGWTFDTLSGRRTSGTGFTVLATPPSTTPLNEDFKLRLTEESVQSGGSTSDNAPEDDVDSTAVTVDTRQAITASWTTIPPNSAQSPLTTNTINLVLTFGQTIDGDELNSSDFNVTGGGSVSNASGSGGTYTITVTQPTHSRGTYTVSLNRDALPNGTSYLEGPDDPVPTADINYDTRRAISVSNFRLRSGSTLTSSSTTRELEIIFNRSLDAIPEIADFSSDDVTVTGITGSGTTYTVTVSQPTNAMGSYTVTLDQDSIPSGTTYLQGPAGDEDSDSISYDTRSALTVSSFGVKSGTSTTATSATREFEIVFGQSIPKTELTTDDFTITGTATVTGISPTSGSNTTYTITVTQPTSDNGTYDLSLDANAISTGTTYLAGPLSGDSNRSITGIQYDTRPRVNVSSFAPELTTDAAEEAATRAFTLTFDRSVPASDLTFADFSSDDVTISQASDITISPNMGSQATYTVTVNQPSGEGSYVITLAMDAIPAVSGSYLAGPFEPRDSDSANYDTRTVATAAWSADDFDEVDGKLEGTITFTGADVTGIETSDFVVLDSAGNEITNGWNFDTLSASTADDGDSLDIKANPPANTDGEDFKLRLKANSVISDGGTTNNAPSGNVDFASGHDIDIRPQLTASWTTIPTSSSSNEITSTTATFVITFSQSVPNAQVTASDFTVSDNDVNITSVTATNDPDTAYTVIATHPTNAEGSYTITLDMNAVSGTTTYKPGPAADVPTSSATYYDVPAVLAMAAWSGEAWNTGDDGKLRGTLTFTGADVTGIAASDFAVLNASDAEQSGWTIVSPATATNGTGILVTATPPSGLNASFKLRLNQTSVRSGGSPTDNVPANDDVDSDAVAIDSRVAINVDSFGVKSGTSTTGATATRELEIVFDKSLDANPVIGDFSATGGITIASVSGTGTTYTVTVNQPDNSHGSYTVSLDADSIPIGTTYLAGPVTGDMERTTASISYDRRSNVTVSSFGPTLTTTAAEEAATREFTLEFDRDVPPTELTNDDFTLPSGVTISSRNPESGNNTDTYTITVNQPTDSMGSYQLTLDQNAISTTNTYLQGPTADVLSTPAASYDTRSAITVTSFGEKTGSTSSSTATRELEIIFGKSLDAIPSTSAFSSNNVSIDSVTGSGTTYTITVTQPTNSMGSYIVTLDMNGIPTGNTYLAGPLADFPSDSISYDTRQPVTASWTMIPASSSGSPITTETTTFQLTVSESIPNTELTTGDFRSSNNEVTITDVSAGSNPPTDPDTVYNIEVTHETNADGNYTITLDRNSISAGNTYAIGPATAVTTSPETYYDVDSAIATATWDNDNLSFIDDKFQGALTFSHNITGISASDFAVLDSSDIPVTIGGPNGWTIEDPPSTADANTPITIKADPPQGTNANFKLRLNAQSVMSDGSSTDNAPRVNADSASILINSELPLLTAMLVPSESSMASRRLGNITTTLKLTFNEPIITSQLTESDLDINNINGSGVSVLSITQIDDDRRSYAITMRHPDSGMGSYTVSLDMNSIPQQDGEHQEGPQSQVTSDTIYYEITSQPSMVPDNDIHWQQDHLGNDVSSINRSVSYQVTLGTTDEQIADEIIYTIEQPDPMDPTGWSPYPNQDHWRIESPIVGTGSIIKQIAAFPSSSVPGGTYRITTSMVGSLMSSTSPVFAIGSPGTIVIPISVTTPPGQGFREQLLRIIEDDIIDNLVIQDLDEYPYQNDVPGYGNLYRLKFTGLDQEGPILIDTSPDPRLVRSGETIISGVSMDGRLEGPTGNPVPGTSTKNTFLAPRQPKAGFSTTLANLFCRPIKNFDVTGLRPGGITGGPDRGGCLESGTAFLHIIDGEKDIYWPQRNNPAAGRLDRQVEYLKIAIDCVFRDLAEPQKDIRDKNGNYWIGNGKDWRNRIAMGNDPLPLQYIYLTEDRPTTPPSEDWQRTGEIYQPRYYRTINQQAVQFVEDVEMILNPDKFRKKPFRFGAEKQYEAVVMNTNLAVWGMLPEAGNSPTDTVRCVFELEIHYPKGYRC